MLVLFHSSELPSHFSLQNVVLRCVQPLIDQCITCFNVNVMFNLFTKYGVINSGRAVVASHEDSMASLGRNPKMPLQIVLACVPMAVALPAAAACL